MAEPPSIEVSDFHTFTQQIGDLRLAVDGAPLWFRGAVKSSYPLLPSLYRHPDAGDFDGFRQLETQLLSRFRGRALPYLSRPMTGDWDALFLMQHFGVPTRLLDWTENPFMALFFATYPKGGTVDEDQDEGEGAAVWVVEPGRWNRKALHHISYDGGAMDLSDPAVRGVAPDVEPAGMLMHPLALYGTHNSPRIVAQRGAFLVFGRSCDAMEQQYDVGEFPAETLTKLVVPHDSIAEIRSSLFSIGTTDSVVFPDLDGLARELRRQFGFRL